VRQKHLIIAPNWIGDAIFSHGLVKVIKLHQPDAQIDVLVSEKLSFVYKMMPEITQVHILNSTQGKFDFWLRFKMARKLSKKSYTHAYVINNAWKHALIPFLARIPNRIGWVGEFRFILINKWRFLNKKLLPDMLSKISSLGLPRNKQSYVHEIRDSIYPRLIPNKKNQFQYITKHGLNFSLDQKQKIVAISPGSDNGTAKRWPAIKYAFLIQKLIKMNFHIWIFGSPKEIHLAEYIVEHCGRSNQVTNLCGKTKLNEALELLALCDIAVCNDSGLLHASAALNLPVIGIYGPTSEKFAPPLTENKAVLYENLKCRPCKSHECPLGHHACMESIEVDRVLSKVKYLIENKKSA
jgi:heptosyltransferase-2